MLDEAIAFYDKVETHINCTVQILTNSRTGETSIGWWPNNDPSDEEPFDTYCPVCGQRIDNEE